MNVLIQFDDQNLPLAAAIGAALQSYASVGETHNDLAPVGQDRTDHERGVLEGAERQRASERTEDGVTPEAIVGPHSTVGGASAPTVVPMVPAAPPIADSNFDANNVAFDPEYCGKAAVPLYGAGKRKGQWKKLRGLEDDVYDTWYAGQRATSGPATPEPAVADTPPPAGPPVAQPPVDTGAAFSGMTDAAPPVDTGAPKGAGELMKWVSEQMNAGHLTQADVDSAYVTADVTPAQLFSDEDGQALGKLYGVLKASLS